MASLSTVPLSRDVLQLMSVILHAVPPHLISMGFVSVGHGFKRRRRHAVCRVVAVPGGSPMPSQRPFSASQKSKNTQFEHQTSTTSPSSQPIPAGFTSIPTFQPSSIEDLPPEVLCRIFCFAGPGSNQLHLTCKHLNRLLKGSDNMWLVERMVKTNHLVDLNHGLKPGWPEKFEEIARSLPSSLTDTPVLQSLVHFPVEVAKTSAAVDLAAFQYPFVDRKTVKFVKKRFDPNVVVDKPVVSTQHKFKQRYLEWRYMILKRFSSMLETEAETDHQELLQDAENSCVGFRDKHELLGFTPLVHSVPIPATMYRPMTSKKLHVVLELSAQFGMGAADVPSLIEAVAASGVKLSEKSIPKLFALLPPRTGSLEDVLALLRALELCKKSKNSKISEKLHQHLHASVVTALTHYYELHPRDNSEHIWTHLRKLQMPDLVDHVVQLGGTMNLGIFT